MSQPAREASCCEHTLRTCCRPGTGLPTWLERGLIPTWAYTDRQISIHTGCHGPPPTELRAATHVRLHLAHRDTRHTLISRTDTCLCTCDLETGQAGGEGCGCWEPRKPISQEESFLAGRRGSDYGVGVGVPGVKDVNLRRGRAEMVPSLWAAGQKAEGRDRG